MNGWIAHPRRKAQSQLIDKRLVIVSFDLAGNTIQLLQPLDRNQRTLLVLIEAKFKKIVVHPCCLSLPWFYSDLGFKEIARSVQMILMVLL